MAARLEHVDVHGQLVERAAEVGAEVTVALDQDVAHRVEVDLVGLGGEVVLALRVGLRVGVDLLAALAEPADGLAEILQHRQARGVEALEVEHEGLDAVVVAREVDDVHEVAYAGFGVELAARPRQRAFERVAGQFLDQLSLGRQHERRAVRDVGQLGLAGRDEQPEQHEQQDEVQDLAQAVEGEPDALDDGPERVEHGHLAPQPPSFSSMRADLPERSRRK